MKRIFIDEFKSIFRDEGAILLFVGALIIYSALYGFIYKPEIVTHIPVAVVDLDNTPESQSLQRMLSATEQTQVLYNAQSLDQAKNLFMDRKVEGIMLIPNGFAGNIAQGVQTNISLYADGSYFLLYSSFMTAVANVVIDKGVQIQQQTLTRMGVEQAQLNALRQPVDYRVETLYNPSGGYATAMLPAVFVVIIQQVLLLGIGLLMGTAYEFGKWKQYAANSTLTVVLTRTLVYILIYVPLLIYLFGAVYKYFGYPMRENTWELVLFFVPYMLSIIFLGFTLGGLVKRRESAILYYAVLSLFFIMISGISWAREGMPEWLFALGQVIPSSSAINGIVRLRTEGVSLVDVSEQWITLWILTAIYFCTALLSVARARREFKN